MFEVLHSLPSSVSLHLIKIMATEINIEIALLFQISLKYFKGLKLQAVCMMCVK